MTWRTSSPKILLAELRPGGWLLGRSGLYPAYLRLHKTDVSADLRKLPPDHECVWQITGDPEQTGHYAKDRRTVIIWLGK